MTKSNDTYEVNKLEKGIWQIIEKNVYMFLVEGEDGALLLDTGFGGGDLKSLTESLTDKPLTVVITHSDGDHTGGAAQFEEVFCHPAEYSTFMQKQENKKIPLLPLWDGDVIDLGGRTLEAIHIPGHTPGCLAFYDEDNKILFANDSIQDGPIYMFGAHRNLAALAASMEKLEDLDLAIERIYTCHNTLEADKSYITAVKEGALAILSGKLTPYVPAGGRTDCKEYDSGKVKFLAE